MTIAKGKVGVTSRYKLRRVKQDGTLVQESGWSGNIITQAGLDFMCNYSTGHNNPQVKLVVGTSNTPPSLGDVALGAQVAETSTVVGAVAKSVQTGSPPYYAKATSTFRFGLGAAAGNIQEVGAVTNFGAATLVSRALISDVYGNPATITVLADEYLDVVWEFFLLAPSGAGTFNMEIDGVSTAFGYSLGASNLNAQWGPSNSSPGVVKFNPATASTIGYSSGVRDATALSGPGGGLPLGGTLNGRFKTDTTSAYIPGSSEIEFTYQMPLTEGNHANGMNAFDLALFANTNIQMLLDAPVMKTAEKVFEITIKLSLANAAAPE